MSISIGSNVILPETGLICEEWGLADCDPFDPKHKERELLRDMALMRGTIALMCGAAGRGKSTLMWAIVFAAVLGREVFWLRWTKPLKVLVVQGENEQWDIGRMRNDLVEQFGVKPNTPEWELLMKNVTVVKLQGASGAIFVRELRRLLKKYTPDLLVIDPALEYICGDTNSSEAAGQWLRREVRPLATEFNCAVWIVHHTAKPSKGSLTRWTRHSDNTYSGMGSSEFGNAPRVVFTLDEAEEGLFAFHVTKKIKETGWRDQNGNIVGTIWLRWSLDASVRWQMVNLTDVKLKREAKRTNAEECLDNLLPKGGMKLLDVVAAMGENGVANRLARRVIDDRVKDGSLVREMRANGAKTQPVAWVYWKTDKPT